MPSAMIKGKKQISFVLIVLSCSLLVTGCMHFSKQKPGEQPDLSQPRQSFYSAPIDRLNSGFINIVSGPFELVNQFREEIKRTNPIRALIPGTFRGVSWFVVREAVGVFEIGTFFVPWKPHLEPIDLDWLSL